MQTIPYNKNYLGLAQDDYLAQPGQFIDSKNVDVLNNGFGVVLGPKSNKGVLTGGKPVTAIIDDTYYISSGSIYLINSTDNTPALTFTSSDTIAYNIVDGFYSGYKYFLLGIGNGSPRVHSCTNPLDKNTYTFDDFLISPVQQKKTEWFKFANKAYFYNNTSYITANFNVITSYTILGDLFSGGMIVGHSIHGTRIYVYNAHTGGKQYGVLNIWDGISINTDINQQLPFNPRYVQQNGGRDIITDDKGNIWLGQGLNFTLISQKRDTNNSFSGNPERLLDFTSDSTLGNICTNKKDITYISNNGSENRGIYQYGNIIPGMKKNFSSFVGNISDGTKIDTIYALSYNALTNRILYSYKDINGIYGVEYIDFNSGAKQTNGYIVYPIERIPNRIHKELTIRITTSNTSGVKAINLYKRLDGGSKQLVRTINDIDNTIHRHKITTENEKFITKQLLVEFINPNGDTNGPILHGLEFDFKIIEN